MISEEKVDQIKAMCQLSEPEVVLAQHLSITIAQHAESLTEHTCEMNNKLLGHQLRHTEVVKAAMSLAVLVVLDQDLKTKVTT